MDYNSMIETYLNDDRVAGEMSFEQQFMDYFTEHAHISHFSRSFLVMLFLGFNDMLLIDGISPKYKVDKIFYGWYNEFDMLKAVILTNEDGKKSMKIRSIFLDKIQNKAQRLLSKRESQLIKRLVRDYELDEFVRKRYTNDLQAERIQSHLTFEVYFFDFMTSLNNQEDLRIQLKSYLQGKRAELAEYTPEAKEYLLQKVKNDPNEITQRSQISLQEIFSRDVSIKKLKLSGQYVSIPSPKLIVEGNVNFQDSKFVLLNNDLVHIAQSPGLLENFKNIYQLPGVEDQRVKDILLKFQPLYNAQVSILSSTDVKGESAECGFTLGASLALKSSDSNSANIKVVQFISEDIEEEIGNNDFDLELEIDDNNAFFLTLEPVIEPNINNMAKKLPIVITFFDRILGSEMSSMLKLDSSLMSKYALIAVDFSNEIKLSTKRLSVGNTIIEDIIVESQLDVIETANFEGQASLESYMERLLNKIQPVALEQKLIDATYPSRYIFGALISSLGQNENSRVYEMRPIKEDPGQFETSYLISFKCKDSEQNEIERYVILNFNEHINSKESAPVVDQPITGFDTLFVHIDQNFRYNEKNTDFGYVKRTVAIHQALMSTFMDSGDFSINPINHVSLDHLKMSRDDMTGLFHDYLKDAFHRFQHLVIDSKLTKNQNLMEYSSNFKAIIDGIFHKEPFMKNVIPLPRSLSTVQYTISGETVDDEMEFGHSDLSDTESESSSPDDDGDAQMHQDFASERLVTVNFKYITSDLYDRSNIHNGMAVMIEKTNLGADENQIANFYFTNGNENGEGDEELMVTKNQYFHLCGGVRKRRSITSCLSSKSNKQKEPGTFMEEIITVKIEILENLATASNSMMILFMIRDLISDVYHQNKFSIIKDVGFLAMTAFSPQIGTFLAGMGELMIANDAKIAGYASKALGFGVSRAISLYVLYDFIHSTVSYVKNTNDTSAKISMEVDGTFLAIDAITLGIQGLETAGYLYGMTAIANPIGAIIGASIIIGLNVYQTMEKVSYINKFIHLNRQELIDESLRAFFHFDPASNVQELMSEEAANKYLEDKALEFLKKQDKYDTFITKSGVFHGKSIQLKKNAVIDMHHMRQIILSRASPKPNQYVDVICHLHEEADEIQRPTFWSGVENFFSNIAHSFKTFYHILRRENLDVIAEDILDGRSSQHAEVYGFACHNSFGIQFLNNSTDNLAAYFNLGDGNDVVSGFANKSNWFQLGGGKKFINGSAKSDIFVLTQINISGILNGADGIDTVDFSAVYSKEAFVLSDESSNLNSLKLKNIENVIGRFEEPDIMICDCSIKALRLNGGHEEISDLVVVPYQNCTYEMTIYLDGYSSVYNAAHNGNFIYVTNITTHSNIQLQLRTDKNQSEKVHNIILNQSFLSLQKIETTEDVLIAHKTFKFKNINANFSILMVHNETQTVDLLFTDGCHLSLTNSRSMHLTLNSKLPIEEILQMYRAKVRALGIPMIAHSLIHNETLTITAQSHQSSNIIHNSLSQQSRIYIENCGNHLLLVNATRSNVTFYFPTIYLQLENCSCSRLTIDFNVLLSQLHSSNTTEHLKLFAERKNGSMLLIASTRDEMTNEYYLGEITILNCFKSKCHQNVLVRSYSDFLVLDEIIDHSIQMEQFNIPDYQIRKEWEGYMRNLLEPEPLIFTSMYKFIALSKRNTEWFSELRINATLGKMEFFRVNNSSLFITNMRSLGEKSYENLCSIYLDNFYESKKLWTLTFEANSFRMSLLFHVNEMQSAASIDELVKSVIRTKNTT